MYLRESRSLSFGADVAFPGGMLLAKQGGPSKNIDIDLRTHLHSISMCSSAKCTLFQRGRKLYENSLKFTGNYGIISFFEGYMMALIKQTEYFCLCDSHARDLHGMPDPNGTTVPYWKVRFSCATDFTPKISRQKQCAGAALETETPSRRAHEGRKIKYSMKINTSNA